jgi:hypothetical protein
MKEKIFFLKKLTEVKIRKRKGSRKMSIRINPNAEVRMTIPWYVSYRDAEKFLIEKEDWIERTLIKVKEKQNGKRKFSENNLPTTRYHEFLLLRTEEEEYSFRFSQGLCEISIPSKVDIASDEVQEWIRYARIETLRKEAKVILTGRCAELAAKTGIQLNNIRVKNMKTRWGSCSTRRNINLNIHLMQLPEHLSDYVIYHELVHTLHPHHGPAFWQELDKYVGNAKELAKEIRRWGWVLEE